MTTGDPFIVSVPVASRRAAFDFYGALGFAFAGQPDEDGIPEPLQLVVNDHARVMLIPTTGFGWVIAEHEVAERGRSEAMLLLSCDEPAEVDATVERAREAGGTIVTEPGEQRWGYAGAFADLDGHLWMARVGLQEAE